MKQKTIILLLTAILAVFQNCVSSTIFETTPPGATLYINGEIIGETPFEYSDKKIIGSTLALEFKKPGYKPLKKVISKEDEVNVGALVGGIFCLFPFLWLFKYKPNYRYELEPE